MSVNQSNNSFYLMLPISITGSPSSLINKLPEAPPKLRVTNFESIPCPFCQVHRRIAWGVGIFHIHPSNVMNDEQLYILYKDEFFYPTLKCMKSQTDFLLKIDNWLISDLILPFLNLLHLARCPTDQRNQR